MIKPYLTPIFYDPVFFDFFIQLVLQEFAALHPGNAVRFGIRPLELSQWWKKHQTGLSH